MSIAYKSVLSSGSGGDGYVPIDNFEITTEPTKLVYQVGDNLDISGMVVTATADGMTGNVVSRCSISPTHFDTLGTHAVTVGYHGERDAFTILVNEGTIGTLEETSWSLIKTVGSAGVGAQYWSVGDTKSVTVNGQIGDTTAGRALDNVSLKVFIIDFNYQGSNGIYFQCYKDSTGQKDIGIDGEFKQSTSNGTKAFNMQHWGSLSFGGWKGCDARYDILGSTDVPPSGYGATTTSGREGYDATATCATAPVPNTFMAALPSDLRSVMAPWTIWTDNVGLGYDESHVTTSVDYLPLISEYEMLGTRNQANEGEQEHQSRFAYYVNGGSLAKYKISYAVQRANFVSRSVAVGSRPTTEASAFIVYSMYDSVGGLSADNANLLLCPAFRVA